MLDDQATLVPATGHYFLAPQFTGPPADLITPAGPWADVGHTSLDSPFGLTSDGGDTTTLGTWQNPALRNSHAPRVESVAFILQQWDLASMKLYWGANSGVSPAGALRAPKAPSETLAALYMVASDGVEKLPWYYPSVSIFRADDIGFDAEALAGMPVRATILGVSGQDWLYEITPKGVVGASSIAVTPATSAKAAGQTTQLTVVATYPDSSTATVTSRAIYTTSDATKATVSAAGLVTFVAAGTATITATFEGKTASCAVTVT